MQDTRPALDINMKLFISTFIAALLTNVVSGFAPMSRVSTRLFSTTEAEAEAAPAEEVSEFRGAEAISALTKGVGKVYALEDIEKLLPHRYPFLLVDKVVELEKGKVRTGQMLNDAQKFNYELSHFIEL